MPIDCHWGHLTAGFFLPLLRVHIISIHLPARMLKGDKAEGFARRKERSGKHADIEAEQKAIQICSAIAEKAGKAMFGEEPPGSSEHSNH